MSRFTEYIVEYVPLGWSEERGYTHTHGSIIVPGKPLSGEVQVG